MSTSQDEARYALKPRCPFCGGNINDHDNPDDPFAPFYFTCDRCYTEFNVYAEHGDEAYQYFYRTGDAVSVDALKWLAKGYDELAELSSRNFYKGDELFRRWLRLRTLVQGIIGCVEGLRVPSDMRYRAVFTDAQVEEWKKCVNEPFTEGMNAITRKEL